MKSLMVGGGPLCLCFSPEARWPPCPTPWLTILLQRLARPLRLLLWYLPLGGPPLEWQDAGWASAGWFQTPQQSRCWVLTVSCSRAWCLGGQDRRGPAHILPLHLPSPSGTPRTPTRGCCQLPPKDGWSWWVGGGGRGEDFYPAKL